MNPFIRPISLLRLVFCLYCIVQLAVSPARGASAPAVPSTFQDLYTTLDNYLTTFNTTLGKQPAYQGLATGTLTDADGNAGPALLNSLPTVQLQVQQIKALGAKAVLVEVGFPILYEPFLTSQGQSYSQFVGFYQQVAATVRAAGLKLVVQNDTLECTANDVIAGWNTAAFNTTLNWTQYQQARAQMALTVAQTMQPDYLVVLQEPDTEALNTGQTEVNTPTGAGSELTGLLASVKQAGVPGMKVGAGVGSWLKNFNSFIQNFVAQPVDYIDVHIYPVNYNFLPNALTIANTAAAAGKPLAMSECWLHKIRDNELLTLIYSETEARNIFSFWAPLDVFFLQTMASLGSYTHMIYIAPFETQYYSNYMTYGPSTENLLPADALTQEDDQAASNMQSAIFTSTAMSYYSANLSTPDHTPPTTPGNLAGSSGQPTTSYLTWTGSTDNVGVAGYYVYRNGVRIGSTAAAFYQDAGLTDGTTYSYAIEAFDLGGNVSPSSAVIHVTTFSNVPPTPPGNLIPNVVSTQQINLTWTPSTDKIAIGGYFIFRGTSAGNLVKVGTQNTTTKWGNYPLTPGTTYYFGVEAVDTDGNVSAMSQVVSATTMVPPKAPVNVSAKAQSSEEINLTWAAGGSGMPVVAYHIFRGTSPSNLTQLTNRTSTTFTDYPLSPSTKYYYAVEEVDAEGDVSPMSAAVSATTP